MAETSVNGISWMATGISFCTCPWFPLKIPLSVTFSKQYFQGCRTSPTIFWLHATVGVGVGGCVCVPVSPAPVLFVLPPDLAFFLLFHVPSALGDPAVSRGWTGPSPELPASPALLSSCGPVTCSTFWRSSSSSSPAGTSPTPAGTPFLCGCCRRRYGVQSSPRSRHRLTLQQSRECMTQVPAGHLSRVPSNVSVCSLVERRGLAPVPVRAVPPTPLVCAAWTRDGRSTLMGMP